MTTIDKDIADAIEKNLPAMIGEQLRKELEQLTKLRATRAAREKETKVARDSAAGWKSKADKLEAELVAHQKLAVREAEVSARERNAEIFELKANAAATERFASQLTSITMGLVRNTEYRRDVFSGSTEPIVMPPAYQNGPPTLTQANRSSSETTTHKVD